MSTSPDSTAPEALALLLERTIPYEQFMLLRPYYELAYAMTKYAALASHVFAAAEFCGAGPSELMSLFNLGRLSANLTEGKRFEWGREIQS